MQDYSEQAERAILAEIMFDEMAMCEIIGDLKPEDFYFGEHQKIYAAAVNLFEDGEAVDDIHLREALKGKVDPRAMIEIMKSRTVMTKYQISPTVQIIRELSQRRQIRNSAMKAITMLNENEETEDIRSALEDALLPMESSKIESAADVMPRVLKSILDTKNREQSRIRTHIPGLDDILGHIGQTDLVIIAARPAIGKTALVAQIGLINALAGNGVYLESLEMTDYQIYSRMISSAGEIDATMLKKGTLGEEDREKIRIWGERLKLPSLFVHEGARTVGEIRANIKKLKAKHDIKLVMIDYLQLMTGKGENRNNEVGGISRGLKAAALDLKVPIIALSQLNRAAENSKVPTLAQLRDSGSLEQDADTVILLHDQQSDYGESWVDLIVAKHRSGPQGTVTMEFKKEYQKFVKVGA